MDNNYELHQHERLARNLGFTEGWITAVEQLAPEKPPELSEQEWIVQRLVITALETRGKLASCELQESVQAVGAEQTMAILFLVGRYMTHALIVNVLELAPPVRSIFDTAA